MIQTASQAAYLGPAAIAAMLQVKPVNVLTWIHSGELRASNVAARRGPRPRWRVSREDLCAFLAGRTLLRPAPSRRHTRRTDLAAVTKYF
jgi:Helix-turn-helix domain